MDPVQKATQHVFSLFGAGDYRRAVMEASRLAARFPNNAELQYRMGTVLQSCEAYADAVVLFRRALASAPERGEWNAELTGALISLRRYEEARITLDSGLESHPNHPATLMAGSLLAQAVGGIDEALTFAEKVFGLEPENELHATNLLQVLYLVDQGRAKEFYFEHIQRYPDQLRFRRLFAFEQLYWEDVAESDVVARIWECGQQMESQIPEWQDFPNVWETKKKLKVGVLSPDLRTHSVAFFLLPLLRNLPRDDFELYFYPLSNQYDDFSREFKKLGKWVDFKPMNAMEFCDRIRKDRLDVLIETGGMTRGARPEILAMQPAPVQISMIGFPHGLGLKRVTARIGDSFVDTAERDGDYAETVFRVSEPFLCYESLDRFPDLTSRPADSPVVFCTMNSARKIGPRLLAVWKRILDQVPGSRLLVKCHHPDQMVETEALHRRIDHAGMTERVDWVEGTVSQDDHRRVYLNADIALDSYPYNGTTTTIEALLMGVPVITRCGDVHRSRVSSMMLRQIGMHDWIAEDEDGYVQNAVRLAGEVARVRKERGDLRNLVEQSALMDGPAYGRKLGEAIRAIWTAECRR